MRLINIINKLKQSLALVGTVWICSSTNEPDETYYKLVFTDRDQVEGWVKYNSEKEEVKVFSADYPKKKNILHVKKQEDAFMAIYDKNQITAIVDGQEMNFSKAEI